MLLFLGASFALVSALVLTKGLKGSPPWPWTTTVRNSSSSFPSPWFSNHTILFPSIVIYVLLSVFDDSLPLI